jgi:hypothetical protein
MPPPTTTPRATSASAAIWRPPPFDIDVAFSTGHEQKRRAPVHSDADRSDNDNCRACRVFRFHEAAQSFPGNPSGHDQNRERVRESGENRAAA